PDFFTVKGTIIFIRSENFCYPACPVDSKKVTEESDKTWRCEKCSKSYDSPDYRYILSIGIADHTGQAWLQAFNDVGIQIMGKTATELHTRKVENETLFSAAMMEANFKTYIFRCRAKMENFQDTTKVRYTIYTASPIDCVAECQRLI
ncbi:1920_t:CDS:2, partial [Paraglomus occultum]